MRVFRLFLLPILLVTTAACTFAAPAKQTYKEPSRIVSLSPSITEMLFAVGLGPRVVGDTTSCDYPPAAKALPKIGGVVTNYERVIALHPDLVVADSVANGAAVIQLKRFPVKVLAVSALDYFGTERALETLGEATGSLDRAKLVIRKMEAQRLRAAAIAAKDRGPAPRVLIVIGADPLWTAGMQTYIGDLITRAGGVNVAASIGTYAQYSREAVLAAQPDVILVDAVDRAAFLKDPAMRALAAVKSGRIYTLPDANTVMRPGPRLGDGLIAIAQLLHPGPK